MNSYNYHISLEVMFQALSSSVRVQIVQLLGAGTCCVNGIASQLGLSQTAVSQHLRVLRLAGIVQAEKHGKFIHYSLQSDAIDALWKFLKELCSCDCHKNREQKNTCGC